MVHNSGWGAAQIGLPEQAQRKAILLGYLRKHDHEVPNSVAKELLGQQPQPKSPSQPQPHAAAGVADALNGGSGVAAACDGDGALGSSLDRIADATAGFSGSDLLELCSQAAQRVLAEHLHELQAA
jgi:SpoVK/Ycf46/Vps4 family AAA+-type ATPase